MVYKISTTGIVSEVVLHDLGARTIVHPTTDLDLGLEYTEHELNNSNDLKEAISLAWIVIEDSVQLDDSRYYKQEDINYIVNNIDHNSLQNLDYDEHRFVSTSLSTGLLKGGRLSVNEEDRSKFNIEEGVGVIVDNYSDSTNPVRKIVHWPSISGIQCDDIQGYEWSTVCITRVDYGDGLGTVVQFPEFNLSDEDRRDLISIGFLMHISTDEISYVETEPYFLGDPLSQLWDFVFNFGSFNVEGNEYGCSGLLKLKKSGGRTYDVGTNYVNTSKSPNVWVSLDEDPVSEIIYYYREQGEWVNSDITTDLVDPNMYDSGDGLLPVTTSGWTIQTIFFYAPWNTTEIQYGQRVYDSQQEALSALSERIDINPWISEYDTFRGWLVVKQGAETIDCEGESVIVHAHKLGTVSSAVGGSGSGEINITRNAGLTGVSLVLPKDGVTLPFKSITATDQIITVSGNDTEKSVDIGVDESKISHSNISDLNSDSHSQYLNSTRGDTRYYTKVSLDGGQLDNRYYTESEVDTISGSLDAKMLYVNGEKELIGDWDAGSYSIKAGGFYFGDARLDTAIFACATGSLTGGSISKCPEDETKIHVEAGTSLYVDMTDRTNPIVEILSWDYECFYPSISGVDTKWVGIQRTAPGVGGIVVSNKFSQLEKRFITILGRCWNFSGTDVIEGTGNYKAGAFNNDKTIQDLAYALGTINIYGNTYYTTTSGVMRLSRSYGEAFRFSANYDNSEVSPNIYNSLTVEDIDYYTYHLFGTFSVPKTDIDCDYYDDNGVRTAIPTDKWTIQRVYYYPVSSITSMTYGQHIYDSYEDAYANMFTESVNLNRGTMEGTALRAYLIVKQGCDDLTDTSKAVLFEAGSIGAFAGGSSGGGGVTDHGALEGLGDDDHTQYILSNGTRNFSGPVKYSYNPTFNNDSQLITKKYVDDSVSTFTTDHGGLSGLSDDDHTQYLNQNRGDTRYNTKEEVTTISGNIASQIIKVHSGLTGLNNDDHTHYLLSNGTRDISGIVKYSFSPSFSTDNQIITKKYVDDRVQVFGTQFNQVSSESVVSTTSTIYQTKLSITTPIISGLYRIGYSIEFNSSSNNRAVEVRWYNSTDNIEVDNNYAQTNSGSNWFTFSGFSYINIINTSKTFNLQYRGVSGECMVRGARIELWRVS